MSLVTSHSILPCAFHSLIPCKITCLTPPTTLPNMLLIRFIYRKMLYLTDSWQHKTSIKIHVVTDEGKQRKWNVTLNKRWNLSSCTKLALSVSWTHGLIAQSVRSSERNSVVVGSNPTQANSLDLLQIIRQWWIPYIIRDFQLFLPLTLISTLTFPNLRLYFHGTKAFMFRS